MANPTYESYNTGATSNGTTFSITKPTGTTEGDDLFSVVFMGTAQTIELSGWTTLHQVSDAGVSYLVARKVAGASEPSSYSPTWGGNTNAVGVIVRTAGGDGDTVVSDDLAPAQNTTAAVDIPSIAAAASGLLLGIVGVVTGSCTFTPPSGMTERVDYTSPGGASLSVATEVVSSGDTGIRAFTRSNTNNYYELGVSIWLGDGASAFTGWGIPMGIA